MKTELHQLSPFAPALLNPAIVRAEYLRLRGNLTYPAKAAIQYARDWAEILDWEQRLNIEIDIEQDDTRVRGNAMASGDDAFDKKVEDEIIERLDAGDTWAWAQVTVRIEFCGHCAEDYLGGCSYADELDFKRGGYYIDMIRRCIADLEKLIDDESANQSAEEILRSTLATIHANAAESADWIRARIDAALARIDA